MILPEGVNYPIPIDTVFEAIEAVNTWCSFSIFHWEKMMEIYDLFMKANSKVKKVENIFIWAYYLMKINP